MKVVFTDRSRGDLRATALFIARDNPVRARSFVEHLRQKARAIAQNPSAFPALGIFADREIRRRVVGRYLIFFEVRSDAVVILRILHGARDYLDVLK